MVMKDADEGDELEVETVDHETYMGRVVESKVSDEYVKLELAETGIDADEVEVVTQKDDVWVRPRLKRTNQEELEDRGTTRVELTDLYGVFWP